MSMMKEIWNFKITYDFRLLPASFLLLGLLALAGYCGKRYYIDRNVTAEQKFVLQAVEDFNVRRLWSGRAWGTLFDHCGVTLTADHVPAETVDDGEAFVGKQAVRSGGLIDAAHYGVWTCDKPPAPIIEGMPVTIIGFPAGSKHGTSRNGYVHFKRTSSGSPNYEKPTWIVLFDDFEPVVGGMSGGLVIDAANRPVGILVTQNASATLTKDDLKRAPEEFDKTLDAYQSSDIVSLKEYWDLALNDK